VVPGVGAAVGGAVVGRCLVGWRSADSGGSGTQALSESVLGTSVRYGLETEAEADNRNS